MTRPQPDDQPDLLSSQTTPRVGDTAVAPASHAMPVVADRRFILRASGLTVGAGVLAACSSPAVVTPTTSSSSSSSSSAGTTSSQTATSAATETSATPVAGGTPTSEVPVGGGTIYDAKKVVVTQPTAGEFKAFDTTCTHQGCPVTSVSDGHIVCPCHGSRFDISTGEPTSDSEAKSALAAKTVTVSGSSFTVS